MLFRSMLQDKVMMEPKDFAIGIRVQHSQDLIGKAQYKEYYKKLPPADYRLRYHTSNDRAVYSFCMCPGGYVVNASTEKNHLVVNGMSNHARDSNVANSAIVVNVTKKDFESEDVLAGVEFQRKWEAIAYQIGNGKIPIQKLADYKNNQKTVEFNVEYNETKGEFCLANIREALPEYVNEAILEAMEDFDRKISGFGNDSVVLCGVETRTSAPVRIVRDENLVSSISNVYPCGEGAGYAGGIMSAAVDGCKVAMAILGK